MSRARLAPLFAIALGVALALAWALVTPLFAEPDEEVHLDYALTLAHRGRPVDARGRHAFHTDADPLTRLLERDLHYRDMRFDPTYRVHEQTSRVVRRDVATGIAAVRARDDAPLPWLAISYPAGYYLAAAEAYKVARAIVRLDRIDAVRALRLLGVFAFAVTLAAGYGSFRRMRLSQPLATLATLVVATFPLGSWLSAMVQPDTFTTALVTVALYCALGVRDRPDSPRGYLCFALVCGALAFVKAHYAALAFFGLLPVLLSGVVLRPTRTRIGGTLFASVVALGAIAASIASLAHAAGNAHQFTLGGLVRPENWLADVFEIYFNGPAHDTFWTSRDWIETAYYPRPALVVVRAILSIASTLAVLCVGITLVRGLARVRRVARRHVRLAIALALRDAALWSYLVWTLGLMALDLSMRGHFGLFGRYWMPVLVPLLALVSRTLVNVRFPRTRVRVRTGVLGAWLAYAVVAAPFAFWQMDRRFYGPAVPRAILDRFVHLDRLYDTSGATFGSETLALAPRANLCFDGFAIDSRFGVPAKGVLVRVDATDYRLAYGRPRTAPDNFNDDALDRIGFSGCVPAAKLRPGAHPARLIVVARDGARLRWPPHLRIVIPRPITPV